MIVADVAHGVDAVVRAAALLVFLAALIVLLTHWAVRRHALDAFGWWARRVRRWSDPLVRPIEHRLVRSGLNPQDAPLWLLGTVLVAGLLAILAERWLVGTVALLDALRGAGLKTWLRLGVLAASSVLTMAIILRVLGSWFGVGRHTRWMRPVYLLTDWIVEPIRRRLPAFGPLDLSPLLAYIAVLILRSLLLDLL